MFSPITELDARGPLIDIIIWVVLVFLTYPLLKTSSMRKKYSTFLPLVFIILFLLYAFYGGDYFRYDQKLEEMQTSLRELQDITYQEHMEPVYWFIGSLVNYNYFLFRAVIFVGAFGLCILSMKLEKISIPAFLLFFVIAGLVSFSVSRLCLAISIALLGYSFFLKKDESKYKYIIFKIVGISLFVVSFFFHKSIIFLLAILILSLLPLKKQLLKAIMVAAPIAAFIFGGFLVNYLFSIGGGDSMINFNSAQSYATTERSYGIGSSMVMLFSYVYYYTVQFFSIRFIGTSEYEEAPIFIKCLTRSVFWIVLVSTLFLFIPGIERIMFYNRFLNFTQIMAIPVLAYSLQTAFKHKLLVRIYYIAFVWEAATLTLCLIGKTVN